MALILVRALATETELRVTHPAHKFVQRENISVYTKKKRRLRRAENKKNTVYTRYIDNFWRLRRAENHDFPIIKNSVSIIKICRIYYLTIN